jgi:hypothetical protein
MKAIKKIDPASKEGKQFEHPEANLAFAENYNPTKYERDNPRFGGPLIAVHSHKDNIMEHGLTRKNQVGYVPALTYKWLHNYFAPIDPEDADKKVKQAEAEYAKFMGETDKPEPKK